MGHPFNDPPQVPVRAVYASNTDARRQERIWDQLCEAGLATGTALIPERWFEVAAHVARLKADRDHLAAELAKATAEKLQLQTERDNAMKLLVDEYPVATLVADRDRLAAELAKAMAQRDAHSRRIQELVEFCKDLNREKNDRNQASFDNHARATRAEDARNHLVATLDAAMSELPIGNLRTHTPENVPARVAELVSRYAQMDRLEKDRDRLAAIIRDIAAVLDPECPDCGAYVDGHCSLVETVQAFRSKHDRFAAKVKDIAAEWNQSPTAELNKCAERLFFAIAHYR